MSAARTLSDPRSAAEIRLASSLMIAAAALLFVAFFHMMTRTLEQVADHANRVELRYAQANGEAMLRLSLENAAETTDGGAHFNDTVERAFAEPLPLEWLEDSWGNPTADPANFAVSLLYDGDRRPLWGFAFGKRLDATELANFSTEMDAVWDAYRSRKPQKDEPVSGIIQTRFGPAIIGFARIRPSTGAVREPVGAERFALLADPFDQRLLSFMEEQNFMPGLRLVPADADVAPKVPLRDLSGRAISALTWDLQMPGVEAARNVWPGLVAALLLVAAMLIAAVLALTVGFRKILEGKETQRLAALRDALSDLPNRRALMERLDRSAVQPGRRLGMSIAYMDLDGFKAVNDTYGHAMGDRLIKAVSERLLAIAPNGAIVARLGGDEFALLAEGSNSAAVAETFAEQALGALTKPFEIDAQSLRIGVSIGISSETSALAGPELLRRADVAMYGAKTTGRNRIMRWSEQLESAPSDRLAA